MAAIHPGKFLEDMTLDQAMNYIHCLPATEAERKQLLRAALRGKKSGRPSDLVEQNRKRVAMIREYMKVHKTARRADFSTLLNIQSGALDQLLASCKKSGLLRKVNYWDYALVEEQ